MRFWYENQFPEVSLQYSEISCIIIWPEGLGSKFNFGPPQSFKTKYLPGPFSTTLGDSRPPNHKSNVGANIPRNILSHQDQKSVAVYGPEAVRNMYEPFFSTNFWSISMICDPIWHHTVQQSKLKQSVEKNAKP